MLLISQESFLAIDLPDMNLAVLMIRCALVPTVAGAGYSSLQGSSGPCLEYPFLTQGRTISLLSQILYPTGADVLLSTVGLWAFLISNLHTDLHKTLLWDMGFQLNSWDPDS